MKKNILKNFKQNNKCKFLNTDKSLSFIQTKSNNDNKKKFLDININSYFTPIKLKGNIKQISKNNNNNKISENNPNLHFKLFNCFKQRGRNFPSTNIYNEDNKGINLISNTSNSVSFTTNFKTESNNQYLTTQFTQITSKDKNNISKSNDNKNSKLNMNQNSNQDAAKDYGITSKDKKIINQRMEILTEKNEDKYDRMKFFKHTSKDEDSLLNSLLFGNHKKINSYTGNDYKKTKTYSSYITHIKLSDKPKNIKLNNTLSRNKNKKRQNNFNYTMGNQNKDKSRNINNRSLNLPDGISTLKNICSKILVPMKISYKKKSKNSVDICRNINNIKGNIDNINFQKNDIDETKKKINKTKVKNLYILIEQKKESNSNQETIEKLKVNNKFIESNIKKLKNETNEINKKIQEFQDKVNETEKEISIKNEIMKFLLKDRDKAKTMCILLHRRIIDLKKRIEEFDNKKCLFDKSLFEIESKFKKEINFNSE